MRRIVREVKVLVFASIRWKKKKAGGNNFETEQNLEKKLEDILSQIKGVERVKVLITYSETEKVVPIYNESSSKSSTAEKDNDGRRKDNRKLWFE